MLKRLLLDGWLRRPQQRAERAASTVDADSGTPGGRDAAATLRREGERFLQAQDFEAAVRSFGRAAALSPGEPALHHALGDALARAGRPEQALASFERAIELKHDYVEAINSQALVFLELRRFEEARDSFNLALAFDERCVSACFGLGMVAWERGDDGEARSCFLRAVELDPSLAAAHASLGTLAYARGRFEEAVAHYERVASLEPDLPELQSNLGLALQRAGRCEDAIAHLKRAVELRADFAEAHFNLGNACHEAGRLDEAQASYDAACRIRPLYAHAWNNLGNVHRDRGALAEALNCYGKAYALRPDYAEAHYNSGIALHYQDRLPEAILAYESACAIRPGYPEARLNLALARLMVGDLARGWEGDDSRFEQPAGENRVNVGRFPHPLWKGEDLDGRRILVWGEQGIGDEVVFAGLFGEIARAARQCVIECAPKLRPLFARSFPAATVIPRADPPHPATREAFDFHVPAGSLARWLRPELESFPEHGGYLVPDPSRVEYWRARLAALGPGLKVGFCWRSNNLKGDRAHACTTLEQWEAIFSTPGVHFVSLQYDECSAELEAARRRFGVPLHAFPEVDLFNDLDEAAALTRALDLVISAPTAVSLLAAALGVETWQMDYGPAWHALGTDRNPWFPAMTQYKRAWDQNWEDIMNRIAGDLRRAAEGRLENRESSRASIRGRAADPQGIEEALAAGKALYEQGAFDAAEAAWRGVLRSAPDSTAARVNVGLACYQQGRLDEAVANYRDALATDPGHGNAHLNLGLALLARGDFAEGWTEYDWRFDEATLKDRETRFPYPRWNGEDLRGGTLLVWKESSLGSQILFAGMFGELLARGGFCIIECSPKLAPLYARSFPTADVVPRTEPPHPYTQYGIDWQIAAGSLGRHLRPALASFPPRSGYLTAAPERVRHWQGRLAALRSGPKVGIAWRSIDTRGERALACTTLEQWMPVLRVPGIHFVNLQYDECARELEQARQASGASLHEPGGLDLFNDIDDSAALMCALDLVVSAPTVTSVLSAALGVPTWQLHHGMDWQMHGAPRHPWFPALRRFQRGLYQPWEETMEEVASQLRAWAAGRGS